MTSLTIWFFGFQSTKHHFTSGIATDEEMMENSPLVIHYSQGEIYKQGVQLGFRQNSNNDSLKDFSNDHSKDSPVVAGDICCQKDLNDSSER